MVQDGSVEMLGTRVGTTRRIFGDKSEAPPWLFQHQDLIRALENADHVDKGALTNTLNHSHFTDRPIFAHLRHPKYEESILVKAHPEPCLGRELTCLWSDEEISGMEFKDYQFLHLVIDDGRSMILVPATVREISDSHLVVQLPDKSYAVGQRNAKRHVIEGIAAELTQSVFQARGKLLDFSSMGFRTRVSPEPFSSFQWFNPDEIVDIRLQDKQQIFFSGACRYIRHDGRLQNREYVFAPQHSEVKRFGKRQLRNPRRHLVPSPNLNFEHPFLKRRVQLEVADISTSGFLVHEREDEGILMPGMVIPELTITFAGALEIKCSAQVIYRSEEAEEGKGLRSGLAILNMDINAYSRLTYILTNAMDSHAYVSSDINMEALWEFFFESGFIYPTKYRFIQSHREDFKETYRKLYQENPEIARHFTYQKNGRIYGHISMVRAYEKAWMIHHHAATALENKRTGLMVLKQIMLYLNDMHRLPSAKMDYLMCYFRPENKFPDRVFGGFARELRDLRGCSLDEFSYLPYTSLSLGSELPDGWSLEESSELDLWELNRSYCHYSGGLLLEALGLGQESFGEESLEETFTRLGFLRQCRAYSLSRDGNLNAVLIVNRSDLGINLSELLNAIKIIITNPDDLPWDVLSTAIAKLTSFYHTERIPVLFFPFTYVEKQGVPYEKRYQLWILNAQYSYEYMEYMQRKFRMRYD